MPIAVVSVPVADQQAAKRFYVDVMGFALVREVPMGPGQAWIQLQPPGGGATIALTTWFDAMRPGGVQGLMLAVPDVDAEVGRLRAAGAAMPDPADEDWGRYSLLADPDGNGWVVATLAADPPDA